MDGVALDGDEVAVSEHGAKEAVGDVASLLLLVAAAELGLAARLGGLVDRDLAVELAALQHEAAAVVVARVGQLLIALLVLTDDLGVGRLDEGSAGPAARKAEGGGGSAEEESKSELGDGNHFDELRLRCLESELWI